MRHLLYLAFATILSVQLNAQTVIDCNSIGSIGTRLYQATDNTPDASITYTSGGDGLLWNFFLLQPDQVDSVYFADPINTPYSAEFPAADFTVVLSNGTISYLTKDTAGLYGEGQINDPLNTGTPLAFSYTPSLTLLEFPSNYQDTFLSFGTGTRTILDPFGGVDSLRITQATTASSNMDGRGILITPLDTFSVLRQDLTEDSYFKVEFGGGASWFTFLEDTITNRRHVWWTDDTTARYSLVSMSLNPTSLVIEELIWLTEYPTTPANNPPITVIDVVQVPEDQISFIDVQANDFDVDGDPLTTSILVGAMRGSALVSNGDSIEYAPNPNFNGSDTLIYQVCDTAGLCDPNLLIINVVDVNDAPIASDDPGHWTYPNTAIVIDVQDNDTDIDMEPLITNIVTSPTAGTTNIIDMDSVEYTAGAGTGVFTFVYSVCDTGGLCDTALVTVSVVATGIEGTANTTIRVFPNPTADRIYVQGVSATAGIRIYAMDGTLVRESVASQMLDLQGLAKGNYVYRVTDRGRQQAKGMITIQ
jgi:hypothetical protein